MDQTVLRLLVDTAASRQADIQKNDQKENMSYSSDEDTSDS